MKTSCLIPCHNATHLNQCLQSIQGEFNEVLIYLNGDCDRGREIVRQFSFPAIIQEDESPVGSQIARNKLFEVSTGDYVVFLDCDDYRVPGHIPGQINYLEQYEWGACIGHPIFLWKDPLSKREVYQEKPFPLCQDIWHMLIKRCLQTGCILWRRSALETIKSIYGNVFNPNHKRLQEYRLVIAALSCCVEIGLYPAHTAYYRWGWNGTQITQTQFREEDSLLSYYQELEEHVPPSHLQVYKDFLLEVKKSLNKLKDERMITNGTLVDWGT
ncbi:glycosyltransferase (plasmid) [Kovacikia minuta CCNUW1]|uniref:glycosyltransferase family 2 protein n=1 Tax=Kovacikia minuta TaxID=2931930 RepID=UPI001CCEC20C|nr:glycosyltransferase family 2 protein [Kovacikia minuta]UBF29831.1 glycosyltransferase [Kovacikia minuta CCNUW1]